jgi:hypothetical protein
MAQAGSGGGRGKTDGRGGRGGRDGAWKAGCGQGYSSKPKSTKVGLCKELEHHVFDYGGHSAADTRMRITQEKIQQYVGIKYGEDIANELKNRVQVVIDQPEYTQAIKTRHVAYETLVRQKQSNLLAAMQTQLANLQLQVAAGAADTEMLLAIAKLENEIADLEYESLQEVPYMLTSEEAAVYYIQPRQVLQCPPRQACDGSWTSVCIDFWSVHSTLARQAQAREELGGGQRILQASSVV